MVKIVEVKLYNGKLKAYPVRFWKKHIERLEWNDGILEIKLKGKPKLKFYAFDDKHVPNLLEGTLTDYLEHKGEDPNRKIAILPPRSPPNYKVWK